MSRVSFAVVLLAGAVGVAGCKGEKPAPPAMPKARVTAIRPVPVPVQDYWTYNGYLDTTESVEVRSKIRGFLAKVAFKEGTEVDFGDPLYKIDQLEFETALRKAKAEEAKAEADIKNLEAQIRLAETERERYAEAVKRGVEARPELDKAQATLDVRIAERDAAVANRDALAAARRTAEIQLGYTDIRAKIGGRISRTLVDKGNLVLADTTVLTTILRVDELYVYFDAPERDLIDYQQSLIASRLKNPNEYRVNEGLALALAMVGRWLGASDLSVDRVPVEVIVGDRAPYRGWIDFRENRVETSTGTIRIRGRLANPPVDGVRLLFPGMYAHVRVPKGPQAEQLTVPEDCLLSGQEGRFVYVLSPEGKVEKRLVTVGATVWKAPPAKPGASPPSWVAVNPSPKPPAAGQPPAPTRRTVKSVVAVTAGLKPGERVILEGLQKARPGDQVDVDEWNVNPPAPPAPAPAPAAVATK